MSTIETAQKFKNRVDIQGWGGRLKNALQYTLGSSYDPTHVFWRTDENGFHILHSYKASKEGWEREFVMVGPSNISVKVLQWLEDIPDEHVSGYESTAPLGANFRGTQRGWRLLVDDKCLGACRVIPAFG